MPLAALLALVLIAAPASALAGFSKFHPLGRTTIDSGVEHLRKLA